MDGILLVLCKLLLSIVLYSVLSYGSLNSTPPQRFTRVKAEFFKLLQIRINYFQIIYQGAYRKWFLLFILFVGYTYFSFSAIIMSFCLITFFIILMEKILLRQQKRKYDALDIIKTVSNNLSNQGIVFILWSSDLFCEYSFSCLRIRSM